MCIYFLAAEMCIIIFWLKCVHGSTELRASALWPMGGGGRLVPTGGNVLCELMTFLYIPTNREEVENDIANEKRVHDEIENHPGKIVLVILPFA